ncbi:hypothetical protein GMOD_00009958 [Pyrenophora seminiperda CCB06]|uniref:Uncharacterized protein n=1 Tax=Pyrenophora seminiperda CCB06 TaxID=1302712 RepID=A0A3M7M1S1_9PLEO|nr:hypothetical protein GMOD_00009958 [Pyrenophora seminiperda CCB06]
MHNILAYVLSMARVIANRVEKVGMSAYFERAFVGDLMHSRKNRTRKSRNSSTNVQDDAVDHVALTTQPSRELQDENQHQPVANSVVCDHTWDLPPCSESQFSADSPIDPSQAVMDIAERLSRLEDTMSCNNHVKSGHFNVSRDNGNETAGSSLIPDLIESSRSSEMFHRQQERETCDGGATSSYYMAIALEKHLRKEGLPDEPEKSLMSACPFTNRQDLPELCVVDLRHWV